MKRYHPALVVLHWLLAILISVGLVMGGNVLSATPNSDPEKIMLLKGHMVVGLIILALTLIRLALRFFTTKPAEADIGNALLNKLGLWAHYGLYLLVILMAVSGMVTSNLAGLPDIVFFGSGASLPASFDDLLPRMAHGVIAKLLMALIVGHIAAFLYHQFIRKDKLISRMWFA
jgi:cytochrome b561